MTLPDRRSAAGAAGEPACRPGSVHPRGTRAGGHPSGTAVAGSLVRSTREHRAGRSQPLAQALRPGRRMGPCDLAPGGVYRAARITPGAGGLLHHRFTLTPGPAETWPGAVCSLWHCPAGHPGSVLPTTLPCGARTFLTGSCTHGPVRPPGRLALPTKDRRLRPTGNVLLITRAGQTRAAGVTKGRPYRKAAARRHLRRTCLRRRRAPWAAR